MPDDPQNDEPTEQSSDDLIRGAWSTLGGTEDSGSSTGDLIDQARAWLEEAAPEEADLSDDEPLLPEPIEDAPLEASDPYQDLEALAGEPYVPPPAPQRTRRTPPRPRAGGVYTGPAAEPPPTKPERPSLPTLGSVRARRRISWMIASAVIGVALFANLASVIFSSDSDSEVVYETTREIRGTIEVPWTDPCSGASITGDLTASITYSRTRSDSTVEVQVLGVGLQGSTGRLYDLEIEGSATGIPRQETFEFEAHHMLLERDDGTDFVVDTELRVEIADDAPEAWSFTMEPFVCRG